MFYENETSNLLRRLGVNNSYVGFRYSVYSVRCVAIDPDLLLYISKGLYIEIADHYETSPSSVERGIRTVINTIWNHGDRELLNEVFGFEVEKKPCNTAFIDALSQYMQKHCQR